MKLSAKLLVWHLRQKYEVAASHELTVQPVFRYACPWRPELQPEPGVVLVLPAGRRPVNAPNPVLLVRTGGPEPLQSEQDLCVLPEDVCPEEAAAYLQQVFRRYEDWNQSLFESRMASGSIQELLDLSDAVIPNPIALVGMDFRLIASKGRADGAALPPPGGVLGEDEETLELVNTLKADPNYEAAFHRTGFFYYPGNQAVLPSLCANIRRSDRTAFRLLMAGGALPLDDTVGFLIEYLARIISNALSSHSPTGPDRLFPLHRTFQELLSDSSADYVAISQQLSAAGWLSSHFYLCVLIKPGSLDHKNMTMHSICGYIENTIPSSCAVEHRDNVVVYINLSLCDWSEDTVSQKLAGFIRDSFLNAGYSRKMLGHFNFHRQYMQASIALQMGGREHPSQWIHHFNDIALLYMLEQITKKLPAYMLCHEKLLHLKNHSDDNPTQLYQTLRRYLENHLNITKTAQDLFIHRSTLLYRLEKIKGILKSDLNDPSEVLYLMLSFSLLDLETE